MVRDGVVVIVVIRIVVIGSEAIVIVVVIGIAGIAVGPIPWMLVRAEVEVIVVDDLPADHVLVAEGDVLQRRRGQSGQSEQNPHRPNENGGAGTGSPVEARHPSRRSCA